MKKKAVKKTVYNKRELAEDTLINVGLSVLLPPYAIIGAIPDAIDAWSQVKNGITISELNDRLRMMTEQYVDVRKLFGYPDRWGHYTNGAFICECSDNFCKTINFIIDGSTLDWRAMYLFDTFEKEYYNMVDDTVHNRTDDDRLMSKNRDGFMDYFNDVYYPWLTKTATSLLNSGADRWF